MSIFSNLMILLHYFTDPVLHLGKQAFRLELVAAL